jgi:hypothetical protein
MDHEEKPAKERAEVAQGHSGEYEQLLGDPLWEASSKGKGKRLVTDGPFVETRELLGG